MWTRTHTIVTKAATKEQMWKLFTDVNNWHVWNEEIEFAKLEGNFESGNHYLMKPKKGQLVKVKLLEVTKYYHCLEEGSFPLAKMYFDHRLEETPDGLKITSTISVKGLLSFLWVQIIIKNIAATMGVHIQQQIEVASKL